MYDGEYVNGVRNGQGKEYDGNEKLIFEGEYKEGKKWNGQAKEYYYDGELIFEGEYIEGQKVGKEYNFYSSENN